MTFEYTKSNKNSKVRLLTLQNLENYLQMDYKRRYPLDLVITESCILKYNRIFFTLLKVKKVVQILKDCWKELNSLGFRRVEREDVKLVREI